MSRSVSCSFMVAPPSGNTVWSDEAPGQLAGVAAGERRGRDDRTREVQAAPPPRRKHPGRLRIVSEAAYRLPSVCRSPAPRRRDAPWCSGISAGGGLHRRVAFSKKGDRLALYLCSSEPERSGERQIRPAYPWLTVARRSGDVKG